jgi:hypothetical protein
MAGAADPPAEVAIEAREPRAQIRAEVLRETKLGCSTGDVLKFIESHFKPKAGAVAPKVLEHPAVGPTAQASEKKGVRSIRLILGRYVPNAGLFFMDVPVIAKTTTVVQWAFDGEGRLIEVFVDKDTELGDAKSPFE